MAKKRKMTHHQTRHAAKKSWLEQLADKKHRPLHAAGLGTIMVFLQGIFEVVGILLIIGAALAYALRAYKANR